MIKTKYTQCAGGIVINDNQEIAIVNQNHNSWSLPKGHVDKGETILDAAIREIYEETGIKDLKLIKPLGDYGRYRIGLNGENDKSEFKTINIFLFTSNQKELNPIDPNNPEAKWIPYNKVSNYLTHINDREFFLKSLSSFIN